MTPPKIISPSGVRSAIFQSSLIVGVATMSVGTMQAALVVQDLGTFIVSSPPGTISWADLGLGDSNSGDISQSSIWYGQMASQSDFEIGAAFYQEEDGNIAFESGQYRNTVYSTNEESDGSIFDAENWISIKNGSGSGWLSFDLSASGYLTGFNHFVYEPTGGTAPTLEEAVAKANGPAIPEPSSALAGILIAIGIVRRSR